MGENKILYGRFSRYFFFFYNPVTYAIRFFCRDKAKKVISENPKILLCCWASLGDVLLASSVIPDIRHKWPLATIGFLCAPTSIDIIEHNKEIDNIHLVPSWMAVGQSKMRNLYSLVYHFFTSYLKAVREIKKVGYDISIELHPFFPNSIPLMRRARINRRIAFTSGGYDVWITDSVDFPNLERYLPHYYSLLLKKLGIDVREEVIVPSQSCFRREKGKIVLHMGTSDNRKSWPPSYWGILGKALKEEGYEILMTGKGEKDKSLIAESGLESLGENLCDRLNFAELTQVVQESDMLISIDSLPVHLAASLGTPFIGLYLYNTNVELWLPEASNCYLFIHNRCVRRSKEKNHPRAIYVEEIVPSDVVSYALQQLKGPS